MADLYQIQSQFRLHLLLPAADVVPDVQEWRFEGEPLIGGGVSGEGGEVVEEGGQVFVEGEGV